MKTIKVTNGKQTVDIPSVHLQTFINSGYKEVKATEKKTVKSDTKKEVKNGTI